MAERIALVVSGADSIGAAVADALAEAGWTVAVTVGPGQVAPERASRLAWVAALDPCDEEAVVAAIADLTEALGSAPRALVFNGRRVQRGGAESLDIATFTAIVEATLLAAFVTTKHAIGPMTRARTGRRVFIADTVALHGLADTSAYAAAQASLLGFARSLTRELGGRNITSNVVAPGPLVDGERPEEESSWYLELTPSGRLTEPADVAAAVEFLLSDDAGFITGVFLPVDGGLAMGF